MAKKIVVELSDGAHMALTLELMEVNKTRKKGKDAVSKSSRIAQIVDAFYGTTPTFESVIKETRPHVRR